MLPFITADDTTFEVGDFVYVPGIKQIVKNGTATFPAYLVRGGNLTEIQLGLGALTPDEKEIIESGCLINYYKTH